MATLWSHVNTNDAHNSHCKALPLATGTKDRKSTALVTSDITCRAINVPNRLLDSLELHKVGHETETLLIHLSTDNVYQGNRPHWTEDGPCCPINAYGRSKREAEEVIQVKL